MGLEDIKYMPIHETCDNSPLKGKNLVYEVSRTCDNFEKTDKALFLSCGGCLNWHEDGVYINRQRSSNE